MLIYKIISGILRHPLNKKTKIQALGRFIRWQLGSRLIPGEFVFEWINKSKLIASMGENGVTGNIYGGLQEFNEMAFLLHALRPLDIFVDIGANVGSYTILASAAVGAKTYSFEPVPDTYRRLKNNISINEINDRVIALNMALGKSKSQLRFSVDDNCMNHVIAENEVGSNSIKVPVSTVDEEVLDDPFVIKIDVEGYELPVLDGAISTLKKNSLSAVIIEINGSGKRYGFTDGDLLVPRYFQWVSGTVG
jgi:FkbM family methyltransferase